MAPLSHMERSLLETSGKSHPTSGQHGIGKAAGLSFPLAAAGSHQPRLQVTPHSLHKMFLST